QRAPQLYAQSLRGDTKQKVDEHTQAPSQTTEVQTSSLPVPLWLLGVGGGAAIATIAFIGGAFWSGRSSKLQQLVLVGSSSELDAPVHETESYHNNSKSPALSGSTTNINEHEDPHYPQS
ncbi:efflux transporter periplasmic adaptor subunit, partial [Fischerella thermalis CCMEE 5205]